MSPEECEVEAESASNDFIINIHEDDERTAFISEPGRVDIVEQDISLAEVKDFKPQNAAAPPAAAAEAAAAPPAPPAAAAPGLFSIKPGATVKSGAAGESAEIWKEIVEQERSTLRSSEANTATPEDVGYRHLLGRDPGLERHFRAKLDTQVDTRSKDLDLIRQTLRPTEDSCKTMRLDEVLDGKSTSSHIQDVFKGSDTLGRGLQSSVDRLQSLKVPQAVVAFAQAAAKANELPGWPLLSSSKPQLQKCEKCSRQFCSTLNYRRHIRLHRRSAADDKDLRSEKSQLAAFLNKLTTEEASEIFSVKNLMIENLSGAAAAKSLAIFLNQTGQIYYPLAYVSAGSALLDVVHNKRSSSPNDLLKVLDDASEGTFLCGGTSAAVQRFVYHGDVQKVGLEDKNVVASLSFLVEQKLVKAWMAEKDAEALRCEKALVEEEEAAQRKRAKILEKKRLKKIRQKGSKEKERKLVVGQTPSLDSEHEDIQSPRIGEEDEYSLPTGSSSSSVVSSGHDQEGVEEGSGEWDGGYEEPVIETDEAVVGAGSEVSLFGNDVSEQQENRSEAAENLVDHKIGKVLRERRRPNYLTSSSYHRRREGSDGYFQSSFKARRVQNSVRNDSGPQPLYRKKLGGMYRGIVKGGNARAVWTRKVNRVVEAEAECKEMQVESGEHQATSPTCSMYSLEEAPDSTKDLREVGLIRESLIVGSLNVPLGNFTKSSLHLLSERLEDVGRLATRRNEEEKPQVINKTREGRHSWSNTPTKVAPAKVWRAVGRAGDQQEADSRSSLTSDGDDSETQAQNKRSHADMLAASDDCLLTERSTLPNVNVAVSYEEAASSAEHTPSPTSTVLASFLSQRWATAVGSADEECAADAFDKPSVPSKAVKIWPIGDEVSDVPSRLRGVTNTCSKSARHWHRSSKERPADQRYMPRRQVFAAQH